MLLQVIKDRYSVRKFSDKKIEAEKLEIILESARLAPSARNTQPWKFVVIQNDEKRAKLEEICRGQKFVAEAPITIAICCNNLDYRMGCGQPASVIDGALASQNIALQCVELGLGTCWIGAFHQDLAAELIKLPGDWEVIGLLPIGYPAIDMSSRNLKPLSEVVSYDKF